MSNIDFLVGIGWLLTDFILVDVKLGWTNISQFRYLFFYFSGEKVRKELNVNN